MHDLHPVVPSYATTKSSDNGLFNNEETLILIFPCVAATLPIIRILHADDTRDTSLMRRWARNDSLWLTGQHKG